MSGVLLSSVSGLSHAQLVTPRRLVEVVDIDQPTVSPDGSKVAFRTEQASVERNTYDTVWYVQNMDGVSPPVRIADGGVPLRDSAGISLPAPATWSPDGRWIYYRAQLAGRIDVWRAATDGSGAASITLDPADVRDFSLSADGTTLNYRVGATREAVTGAEQAEYDRGTHIDESVPIGQNLYRSGYIEGRPATQRFGNVWFDRASLLADEPDHWKAIDLVRGTTRDLPSSEIPSTSTARQFGNGASEPWRWTRDPHSGRIALLTRVGEREGLREKPDIELSVMRNGEAAQFVKCRSALCVGKPITNLQWRPNSDEVLFTVTDPMRGQAQAIFRWNVDTGRVRALTFSHGLISGGRDPGSPCGASSDALACVTAQAARPPRLERIDLTTGSHTVLFDPNAGLAYHVAKSVPPRLLRWTDKKGRPFSGHYYAARRTRAGPSPLFVSYYECSGFLRGAYGDEWPLAPLAESGIAALCINRAPGYALEAVERYDQGLGAIAGAVALLAAEGEIDRAKVGVGGLSFGSEIALWVATESALASAISVSTPVISLNYYQFSSMKGEPFFAGLRELWGLGTPDETPERWRIISPTFKLDRINAPVLFQMSEQEYLYSLDYAIPLIRAQQADLYVFPNEPHQKFQPRHKLAVYERNLDWFRFWLQGVEDSDPTKASQYARWRLMRASRSTSVSQAGVPPHP